MTVNNTDGGFDKLKVMKLFPKIKCLREALCLRLFVFKNYFTAPKMFHTFTNFLLCLLILKQWLYENEVFVKIEIIFINEYLELNEPNNKICFPKKKISFFYYCSLQKGCSMCKFHLPLQIEKKSKLDEF